MSKYVLYCDRNDDTLILTKDYDVVGYTESIDSEEILSYFDKDIESAEEIGELKGSNIIKGFENIFKDFKSNISSEELDEYKSFIEEILPKGDILAEFTK